MGSNDGLGSNSPIFCTAEIPVELLNEFFEAAMKAPELADEGAGDAGVLINTRDVASIVESTKPPLTKPTSYPFAEKNVEEVWSFSQDNLRGEILRRALGILDKQSLTDKMCLLVTKWEQPPAGKENELLTVRADFRSTLVVLTVKNLGIGGDEHFQTDADDGVIRIGPR